MFQFQDCDEFDVGAMQRHKPDCEALGNADVEEVVGLVESYRVDGELDLGGHDLVPSKDAVDQGS